MINIATIIGARPQIIKKSDNLNDKQSESSEKIQSDAS